MPLFERKDFISHSGKPLTWKIECDFLEEADFEALAHIIATKFQFADVFGVGNREMSGGRRFARALKPYCNPKANLRLIADDVLTTGNSMESAAADHPMWGKKAGFGELFIGHNGERLIVDSRVPLIYGVVVFSRALSVPEWILPMMQMTRSLL